MQHNASSQDLSLLEQPITRLFWRYSIPTIMSMLVTGIYVTIDGIFIGHYLGEQGMAGMILAYPVASILYAVGALIGMGSAALVSINLGKGHKDKARAYIGHALSLCLISGVVLAILGTYFSNDILILLGAKDEILIRGNKYLFWYFAFGVFPILSIAFSTLLRNDGKPVFVTWVLILGGVLNVFLDWLWIAVFPYGLTGAAIATMVSQMVTGLLCLQHFFFAKTDLKIDFSQMKLKSAYCLNILRLGIPSFLMNLYLSIVLTMHNMAFLWVGTSLHVAAYGVVCYAEALFYLLFEGIAFGVQPILSFNAGAGRYDRVLIARKLAFTVTIIFAAIGLIAIYGFPYQMVYLFAGDNQTLTPVAIEGMYLYFWGLPLAGLLLVGASFFQAVDRAKEASILTGSKLMLIALVIFSFASIFGTRGIWISLSVSSAILFVWMWRAINRVDNQYQHMC